MLKNFGKTSLGAAAWVALAAAVALAAVMAVSLYYRGSRALKPALAPAPQDISAIIGKGDGPLTLPPGFSAEVFAKDLGDPRVLVTDPNGVLVVSVPGRGQVLALPVDKTTGRAKPTVVVDGLNGPHGLAFRCLSGRCRLYVAQYDALTVFDYDPASLKASNPVKLAELPTGGNHVTRSLLFLPPPDDDRLLVAVGSTCNVCVEKDWRRAKILVIGADGGALKEYARGLRNSVFQTIRPGTREVWATEMGRDWLGDDLPPDEVNVIEEGKDYGWPICYGQNVHDTDFDKNVYVRAPCVEPFETPARVDVPAHSAPLGLAFAAGAGWPSDYAGDLFVAYHGSWNRSVPTGYKVVRVKLDAAGRPLKIEDLITGWLRPDGSALGRPTGLLAEPDGTLFIADDKAGVVYRVYRAR